MKIRFNAKSTVRNSVITDTIFLLDEPGSYLHLNAQDKLCSNLRRISEEDGVVIYCTHSHHLLNPEYIPCNTINITEKKDKKLVQLTPINKYPTRMEKKNTLQPVYEALGLSPYDVIKDNNKVICVEGIYDKYVLELFCNLPNDSIVFPGSSADSIVKNIQYFIAYSKDYIAIWDNDEEGKKHYDIACKCYGEEEVKRLDLLPKGDKSKRRMENMFSSEDLEAIKELVGIEGNTNYENIMLAAYYYPKRKEIKKCLSEQTISNFEILDKIIEKRFSRK